MNFHDTACWHSDVGTGVTLILHCQNNNLTQNLKVIYYYCPV